MRLDDVAQALLEGAVAPVGVRMEPLHQGLVLGLDGGSVGRLVEAENVEGPAHGAGVARPLGLRRGLPPPGLGEVLAPQDPQGIGIGPFASLGPRGLALGLAGSRASRVMDLPADYYLETIKSVIETAGGTMDDVTMNHIFLKDWADYAAMNKVYAEYFPGGKPARFCIVCGLVRPDFLVEIASIAHVGKG